MLNKHDIIQQWVEDQKEIDPEALGWKRTKALFITEYVLDHYMLTRIHGNNFLVHRDDPLIFDGNIYSQGELRILMKMLNIE